MFKMKSEKFYRALIEERDKIFGNSYSHGTHHPQRVLDNCLLIVNSNYEDILGADLDIIRASAILHDIARSKEDLGKVECHAEEGAKLAREVLGEFIFPKYKIDGVCYAIKVHRFSKGLKAETIEAKILQDADRLDALGAIAVARIFDDGGKKKRPMYNPDLKIKEYNHNSESESSINHFYEKTLKIKPETFRTKKAQEIAKNKYKFVKDFVNRFIKEWNGEF